MSRGNLRFGSGWIVHPSFTVKPFISSPARKENFRFWNSLDRNVNKVTRSIFVLKIWICRLHELIISATATALPYTSHEFRIYHAPSHVASQAAGEGEGLFIIPQRVPSDPMTVNLVHFSFSFLFSLTATIFAFPFFHFHSSYRVRDTHTRLWSSSAVVIALKNAKKPTKIHEICPPTQHLNTKFNERYTR